MNLTSSCCMLVQAVKGKHSCSNHMQSNSCTVSPWGGVGRCRSPVYLAEEWVYPRAVVIGDLEIDLPPLLGGEEIQVVPCPPVVGIVLHVPALSLRHVCHILRGLLTCQ